MSDQPDPTEQYDPEGGHDTPPGAQGPGDNLPPGSFDDDESWMDRNGYVLLASIIALLAGTLIGFLMGGQSEGVDEDAAPTAAATEYITVTPSAPEPETVTEYVTPEPEVKTEYVTVEPEPVEPEVVTETVEVEVETVPQACSDSINKAAEVMDLSGQERDLAVEAMQALADSDDEAYQDKVDEMEDVADDRADARDEYDKLATDCQNA